jgi:Fe-S cluster biogenesis protein NfuA
MRSPSRFACPKIAWKASGALPALLDPGFGHRYIDILPRQPGTAYSGNSEERVVDKENVRKAIQEVRPSLQADGGDIELIDIADDGKVTVRLTGACGSCPMAVMTLKQGVEAYLKKVVPEVTEVVQG